MISVNTSVEFDSVFHSIDPVRSLTCASEYLYFLDLVCVQLLYSCIHMLYLSALRRRRWGDHLPPFFKWGNSLQDYSWGAAYADSAPGLLTPDPVSYFSVSSPVKSGFLSDLSAYVTQPLTQCIETLWSHRNVLTLAKWRLVGKIMKSLRELMRRLSVKLGNGQEGPRSRDLKKHHQTPTVSGSLPKSQSEGQAFCWRGWNHLLSFG